MTKTLFEWNIVYPQKTKDLFKSQSVKANVLNAMRRVGNAVAKDLNSTTEFWIHKPVFNRRIRYAGGNPILEAHMDGSQLGIQHWNMVNMGTARRYVMFDRYYQTKTQYPGSFHTNTKGFPSPSNGAEMGPDGRLHWKIVGRSNKMLPGIRPRYWSFLIAEHYKYKFGEEVSKAITKGLQ